MDNKTPTVPTPEKRRQEIARLRQATSRQVACLNCGSSATDVEISDFQRENPEFRSCCPERLPVPLKVAAELTSLRGKVAFLELRNPETYARDCRNAMLADPTQKLIPRSCPRCGLGPCKYGIGLPDRG